MRKILLFTLLLSFIVAHAQPTIEWQKTIGGTGEEYGHSISSTSDGGYIIGGSSTTADGDITNNHGGMDASVIKINSTGGVMWQKSYGGSGYEYARAIQQTIDGGYVFISTANSNDGDITGFHGINDYWLVKLDSNGNIEWQKCYGGTGDDSAETVLQLADGSYIIGGYGTSTDGDQTGNHGFVSDLWVLKVDSTGSIIWQKSYGGTNHEYLYSLEPTNDGGFIIGGDTLSDDGNITGFHGDFDIWIVKIDSQGILEWQKTLGSANFDSTGHVSQTSDNGYIVCGRNGIYNGPINPILTDGLIIKLDSSGEIEWQTIVGGSQTETFSSIIQTTDGSYIAVGFSSSNDGDLTGSHGDYDALIVKLTGSGALDWHKLYGGTSADFAKGILQNPNGSYTFSGMTKSNNGDVSGNHGNMDCWIVKLEGELSVDQFDHQDFVLYPNPAGDFLKIKPAGGEPDSDFTIYDVLGKYISGGKITTETVIPTDHLKTGEYFVRIGNGAVKKFIKK
jgi:hypothetical protein